MTNEVSNGRSKYAPAPMNYDVVANYELARLADHVEI